MKKYVLSAAGVCFAATAAMAAPVYQFTGSQTLASAIEALIKRAGYDKDPTRVLYVAAGSTAGETAISTGKQKIAPMSRVIDPVKQAEANAEGKTYEADIVGLDGIVMWTNKVNTVKALSAASIGGIFHCDIKKWEQLPANENPNRYSGDIKVFRRDDLSGTTASLKDFLKAAGVKDFSFGKCAEIAAQTDIATNTAKMPLAIGYAGTSAQNGNRGLPVIGADGVAVAPSDETVQNFVTQAGPVYPFSRYVYIFETVDTAKAVKFDAEPANAPVDVEDNNYGAYKQRRREAVSLANEYEQDILNETLRYKELDALITKAELVPLPRKTK